MKILVTNTVAMNGGDAAILTSLVKLLMQMFGPDAQIRVYGQRPEVTRRYYPDLAFHPELYTQIVRASKFQLVNRLYGRLARTWEHPTIFRLYAAAWLYGWGFHFLSKLLLSKKQREALLQYADADLIVSTGGTYLLEHYGLDSNIFDLMISVLLRKPLVLFTQSLGPFEDRRYRKRLRQVFRKATIILLRDERSANHIRHLGLAGDNIYVTADVAFGLANPQNWDALREPRAKTSVAISVREWTHFRHSSVEQGQARYAASIRDLTIHLVRHYGAEVVFLSTCQGIPEYRFDDARYAARLREMLPPDVAPHVVVDSGFHSPQELLQVIPAFDLVISTRMHMSILALCAGVPVVTIAYEFKSLELYRALGHNNLVHDIETITSETMIRSVDEVLLKLSFIRDCLRQATLRQKERVHLSALKVKQAYDDHARRQTHGDKLISPIGNAMRR